jgi:hypothetical protein
MIIKKTQHLLKVWGALFLIVFLLMLIFPLISGKFNLLRDPGQLENRKLEAAIPFSFSTQFSRQYEAYYREHFGSRLWLVTLAARYKIGLFQSSPLPDKAQLGRDGWLFYNDTSDHIVDNYLHRSLLTEEKLRLKYQDWESQRDSCRKLGAVYYKVFWPDKQTIYPEKMPVQMRLLVRDTLSFADQMGQYLKRERSGVQLIDVRAALMAGKSKQQLYLKLDSHWNAYGAFLGYSDFMRQISDSVGVNPLTIKDFRVIEEISYEGDLLRMMGLADQKIWNDRVPVFLLKDQTRRYFNLPVNDLPPSSLHTVAPHCGNRLRVLMFRDSYGMALTPFFSYTFYDVVFIWQSYNWELVKQIRPDIVIDATVERHL